MRVKVILFFSLLTQYCISQQLLPIQYDTTFYSHEIIFSGMGEYSSSSLKNEFTDKLINGGYITDQIKNASFSKHKMINRLGVDLNTELEYRNMKVNAFKKEKIGFLVKGGDYLLGSAIYTKDLFGLGFYGNSNYLDQTTDLAGSQFTFISFQKIGFGLVDKITKSNFSFNFYNISDYSNGYLKEGKLTENVDGTAFSLQLNGELNSTTGKSFSKGIGFGIDIDYRISMNLKPNKKTVVQFLFKNIGFANYFTGIQNYRIDSTYSFDGLKLNQIYGEHSIFKDDFSVLDTLNIQKSTQKKTMFLPGFLQVGKIIDDNYQGKFQSFFGIRLYPSLTFTPSVFIGCQYKVKNWLEVGTQGTIGGFSNVRLGIYSSIKIKKWVIGVASQDVYGMISKNGYGKSILIRLRCKI